MTGNGLYTKSGRPRPAKKELMKQVIRRYGWGVPFSPTREWCQPSSRSPEGIEDSAAWSRTPSTGSSSLSG
jgi:hypothetical protein